MGRRGLDSLIPCALSRPREKESVAGTLPRTGEGRCEGTAPPGWGDSAHTLHLLSAHGRPIRPT
jgi:hypothetical protein